MYKNMFQIKVFLSRYEGHFILCNMQYFIIRFKRVLNEVKYIKNI